jgi:hypothetical protein
LADQVIAMSVSYLIHILFIQFVHHLGVALVAVHHEVDDIAVVGLLVRIPVNVISDSGFI